MKCRSIKVNVRFSLINSLRYLTFSSVHAVFGWLLPGFIPLLTHTHQLIYRLLSPRQLPTLFRKFCNNVRYAKPSFHNVSIRALSLYDILPITKLQLSLEILKNCNAMLHVYIKIMMSQQRWYLLLSYFNNKITFLFSCEIRSWSLHFCHFDMSN